MPNRVASYLPAHLFTAPRKAARSENSVCLAPHAERKQRVRKYASRNAVGERSHKQRAMEDNLCTPYLDLRGGRRTGNLPEALLHEGNVVK
jgi:hypothetical protein